MLNVGVRKKLLAANPCAGVEFPAKLAGLFRPHHVFGTCPLLQPGKHRKKVSALVLVFEKPARVTPSHPDLYQRRGRAA